MAMDQLMSLPKDLLVDIFTKRLQGEEIRACRCVCKTLHSFIARHFGMIKNNINQGMGSDQGTRVYISSNYDFTRICLYSFNGCSSSSVEPMKIQFSRTWLPVSKTLVGYSNGLACILQYTYSSILKKTRYDIVLWNPFIQTIHFVTKPKYTCDGSLVGFGFLPQTMDYKVVKLVQYKRSRYVEVEVYSLISDSWKTISMTTGSKDYVLSNPHVRSPNTFVEGCAHWIVNRRRKDHVILCFNMAEEVFHEIDMPAIKGGNSLNSLTRFRDSLALFASTNNYEKLEVWVMKDYGIADSWSRLYRLTDLDFYDAYEIMDSGKILMITWKYSYFYYDPVTEERTKIDVKRYA